MGSAEKTAHGRTRKHIFAIDHDPDFLDIVRELLQSERYNVTATNYVARTWDQIALLHPDLLIVDVRPQSQPAWDLLERLHSEQETKDIPVIITSTDRQLLQRAQRERERYGGNDIVTKPLDVDALLEAIHALIGEP
jgi:two-component system, sensor histidine kinase and response regulator